MNPMTERLREISKNSVVPISVGLLIVLLTATTTGTWTLANRVISWELRLDEIERKTSSGWSYYMERESWKEFVRMNEGVKGPDLEKIRNDYLGVYR